MFEDHEIDPSIRAPEYEEVAKGFEDFGGWGEWSTWGKIGVLLGCTYILAIIIVVSVSI